jgi:type II secretory pathway pseudopilin PulG
LLELLVAVVIVAAVTGILTRAFSTSSRLTARSQHMGNETVAAQNVIETVKALGVRGVLRDTGDGLFGAGSTVTVTSTNEDPAAGPVEFTVTGIVIDGSVYNADVRIDPNTAVVSAINNVEIPDFMPMDAVFVQPLRRDEEAAEHFVREALANLGEDFLFGTHTPSNFLANMTRQIDIVLNQDANGLVTAETVYTYRLAGVFSGLGLALGPLQISSPFFWGDEISAVYVCYRPFLRPAGGITDRDTIIIRNELGPDGDGNERDVTLYLLRQDLPGNITSRTYSTLVTIAEPTARQPITLISNDHIDLQDNVTHVSEFRRRTSMGSPTFNTITQVVRDNYRMVTRNPLNRMFDITVELRRPDNDVLVMTVTAAHLD